ncbi:hypothetical protein GF337_13185 [candidate division KSB1 bacterium]|nr:hypothetical protein [candidate division KSB1 bacterium]
MTVAEGEHWEHSFRVFWIIKVTNQPQMAFWLEDSSGNYVSTIYVTHRTATQDWRSAPGEDEDEIERKSALPVWVHQHQNGGIMAESTCSNCHDLHQADEKKVAPDSRLAAITGATPEKSFTKGWSIPNTLKAGTYIVKAEINHSKDFNDYYNEDAKNTDSAYSGGEMGSGQPSVIWKGKLHIGKRSSHVSLEQIGLGHPAGRDGKIYSNFKNLDSALKIVESITVKYTH